jgi:hypothetical protein
MSLMACYGFGAPVTIKDLPLYWSVMSVAAGVVFSGAGFRSDKLATASNGRSISAVGVDMGVDAGFRGVGPNKRFSTSNGIGLMKSS